MAETLEENVSVTSKLSVPSLQRQIESCEDSWCIQVTAFSRTLSMQVKSTLRNRYSFLPFKGAVSLSEPKRTFSIFLDFSRHVDHRVKIPEDDERLLNPPVPTYFTRALLLSPMKNVLQKFSLKQRVYLGPTSLDEQLAFVMCNLAAVSRGNVLWEPFVGTGGLAVCATYRGAFVLGSDIDIRVLKGLRHAGPADNDKTPAKDSKDKVQRDIRAVFAQYNLPVPELVRMDAHIPPTYPHDQSVYDAIITDPPYGIRAGARKSGRRGGCKIDPEMRGEGKADAQGEKGEGWEELVPPTQPYLVEEVVLDLLHNAAYTLKLGGVLAYLLPTPYDFDPPADLPPHPCLSVIHVLHQPLSGRHGRRVVVARKTSEYGPLEREAWDRYVRKIQTGEHVEGLGGGFASLIGRLQQALSADAYQNDSVVKRLGSCGQKRRDSKVKRRELKEKERLEGLQKQQEESPTSGTNEQEQR
eukprot:gene24939-30132_t